MSAKVEMEGMQERGLLKINTWMTCRRISYIKMQERQNMDLHIFVLFIMRRGRDFRCGMWQPHETKPLFAPPYHPASGVQMFFVLKFRQDLITAVALPQRRT